MPLPPLSPSSHPRTRKHVRRVELSGFKRDDGNWDIEARIVDLKDHDYHLSSGTRAQGLPVHDMSVRVTIDRKMNILDAVACSVATPYPGLCESIAPQYAQLVGLNLFHGFRKAVKDRFGGVHGCSHLSELLMHLPTAALQTFASEVPDNDDSAHKPYQLDRCHALDSHAEAVRRYYPRWYRAPRAAPAAESHPFTQTPSPEGEPNAGNAGAPSNPGKENA